VTCYSISYAIQIATGDSPQLLVVWFCLL